jgi:hypothetical protein
MELYTPKIALLMSGHLNTFNYKEYSKKWCDIINKLNIDVFCVTDDNNFYDEESDSQIFSVDNKKKDMAYIMYRFYKNNNFLTFDEASSKIDKILIKYFGNNLKDKKIFKYDNLNLDSLKKNINHITFCNYATNCGRSEVNINGMLSQFYKLKECYNLMCNYENKNNFNYDIIIRCRFDFYIENLELIQNIDFLNKIYSSYGENGLYHMNDFWAIGNRYIMEKYCNYYDNFSFNLFNNWNFFIYFNKNNELMKFEKGYNLTKDTTYDKFQDVSDATEVGITYIIEVVERYKVIHDKFNIIDYRYYIDEVYKY